MKTILTHNLNFENNLSFLMSFETIDYFLDVFIISTSVCLVLPLNKYHIKIIIKK